MDPLESLIRLNSGNARFVSGEHQHPRLDEEIRLHTYEKGQQPFVAVLSCADSRAPVELVFDQGIGDVFSVRNAGNVCGDNVIGTLELGVYKFNIPLLAVVGHTDCGAIKLAIEGEPLGGTMDTIIEKIVPVVYRVRRANPELTGAALMLEVTKSNALHVTEELQRRSELLHQRVNSGALRIVAGLHYLDTGKVEWL